MRIEFAPEAVDDLAGAIEFLQERNPRAAAATAAIVFAAIDKLAAQEFEGPERYLRSTSERVRSWPVPPYRLYYRREPQAFLVLRIHHGRRDPISR